MLSDKSRRVVEATLPVVAEHIGEIAERFYEHMFSAHPELLDGVFNRGNQASGEQQRALAGSVAAYATKLLETPERTPEHLLSRIAHKHASLGIRPDQYQIVNHHLMWAIADTLGQAATPEVAGAWNEVYWLMAHSLIHEERGLYGARGVTPETVWRPWEVEKKFRETRDVVTFVVKRIDDRLVRTSLPGQYVTVRLRMPDGVLQPRQYSLTRADDGAHRQFSVKRVEGGDGRPPGEMSTLLHDSVDVGDMLTLSLRTGTSYSTTPGDRWSSPRRESASRRWPGCSPTSRRPSPDCRSRCSTRTWRRPPSRCAARWSMTSSNCRTRSCTSGTRTALTASNR
ncbi:hypothetical protein Airi02_002350 [Actinoallomurus iriomotensis]|uniref:nitric oxide dioxygenase n=1 Tax=Actinoallomurus iriomotensis TaxID=478107 RepID=A0A9W6RV95_9ACTN|nr:hypothetical protein Airi02_002350 [Actinoallomurus iriomotensis]